MKIKSPNIKGKRSINVCKHCGETYLELDIKLRNGTGKFCCNDCYKQYRSVHKKDKKIANSLYQKKFKYGLNESEYNNLFKIQNNKCAICGLEFNNTNKAVVDHNHVNGNIRGLLCTKCNTLLGMANDNIDILKNAINYLNSNN